MLRSALPGAVVASFGLSHVEAVQASRCRHRSRAGHPLWQRRGRRRRSSRSPAPVEAERGNRGNSRGIDPDPPRHVLLFAMWSQREVIDYALQRRSTLEALKRPGRSLARHDACDADPLLIRAAKYHGEPASGPCPVCESTEMVVLSYVFGDQLGQYSGRIKRTAELEEMAHDSGIQGCRRRSLPSVRLEPHDPVVPPGRWSQAKPPRRQQTVEDIYG